MKKVKLVDKLKIDGVEVDEISLREPKVKDIIAISKNNISENEREVRLIANLAEISVENVMEMSFKDYSKVQSVIRDFLAPAE